MKKDVTIIIPAFNEEKVISQVIKDIKKHGYTNIIVIDDGSSDKTYEKVKKEKVLVLRHFMNRGKGAAMKTGLEAAKILHANQIVTMDADGQHNPADINKMIDKLREGYDVVLGSRLISNRRNMPYIRLLYTHIGNLITWFLYGTFVTDSQSGFRAYSKHAIGVIHTELDQYEYDSEIIREIKKHKLKFTEVSIEVRYTNYSKQKLHKQSFSNGVKTVMRMVLAS